MDYQIPPLRCLNCKKRKCRCDNGQPACGACFKRNEVCTRYEHALDAVLRDQSAKVVRNGIDPRLQTSSYRASPRSQSSLDSTTPCPSSFHSDQVGFISLRPYPNVSSIDAVYFFLQNYAGTAVSPESAYGYMDLVRSVYLKSSSNSPVMHAITAISVYLQEAWSDLFPETYRAKKYLGKALQSVNRALVDSLESVKDETLTAVLLLDLQDSLSSMIQSRRAFEAHFSGVIALINHRGSLNYKTDIARRLIVAVRHQIVEWSNAKGIPIDTTAAIWCNSDDSVSLPENKATELDALCLRMNQLYTSSRLLLDETKGEFHDLASGSKTFSIQLYDTFKEVKSLDESFEAWHRTTPGQWQAVSINGELGFDMYQATCDVYPDLNVATVINNYRVSRATLLRLLIQLSSLGSGFWSQQECDIRESFQQIIDEFCASVPFFLGNTFSAEDFDEPKIYYPGVPGDPERNRENRRQATAYGGTKLLSNLRSMLNLTSPDKTFDKPLVRAGQRDWMMRQLLRIAIMYNVRSQANYPEGMIPPLVAEQVKAHGEDVVHVIGEGVTFRV